MMKNEVNVASKYNRCLAFTLSGGKVIEVKVLGDKLVAATDAKLLLTALVSVDERLA